MGAEVPRDHLLRDRRDRLPRPPAAVAQRAGRGSLAQRLDTGCLHHVSSVAGDDAGPFGERDFDLGQHLPSPYHATKCEASSAR